jgi:L-lactate dehydrogenase complex protein LldG
MSWRESVLGAIRRGLAAPGGDAARREAVAKRLGETPWGPIPARGQLPAAAQATLFAAKAEEAQASVARVASSDEVPAAVARYLRDRNLPAGFRMGNDPRLAALPWALEPQLAIVRGRSHGDDPVGLSHAEAGIAETGTLMLVSGPDNPTTLNFLPETHIVVLDAATVAGDYETAFAALRRRTGGGPLPRTVNLITGPSRSADIEQTILLGAHGPRRLHIVMVG